MADIFLAKKIGDRSSQVFVIKKVTANAGDKWYYSKLFLREAKLSLSFHHPNLVRTFEMGTDQDSLYLVQEYIDGVNLRDIMKVVERDDLIFPATMAYYLLAETSLGLSYLHGELSVIKEDQVCIHRDLSPHNIMVSHSGDVKIIDFGITKSRESESLTKVGSVRGKYAYMSPEQVRGENLTPASDIFSLGIVFYELLSGKRFFEHLNEVELIKTLDAWSNKDLETRLLNVGSEDGDVLKLMLAPDPSQRVSALRLRSIMETRLKALDANYDKKDFAQALGEFTKDIPIPQGAATESRVVMEGPLTSSSAGKTSMPQQITLYDVLTKEPKKSNWAMPLAGLMVIAAIGGWYYRRHPELLSSGQRELASSAVPAQRVYSKSILLRFDNFKDRKSLRVAVNGRLIDSLTIQNGFKVYDQDVLVIQYYSESQRRWIEHKEVINTSKPPVLTFEL
ncbi:MAG: serine/threonine protein kinase [Bdellovibrio sp.]|nr:serine/threonine protein kinase [Bdellovibrio sp.]